MAVAQTHTVRCLDVRPVAAVPGPALDEEVGYALVVGRTSGALHRGSYLGVTFRRPDALPTGDDTAALGLLRRYYGRPPRGSSTYTGAAFDGWDSTGTRTVDADRFTADDLVAVTFLSVRTPGPAAILILRDKADEINAMLAAIGPDRDLVDEPPITPGWPAGRLNSRLRKLDRVGPVIASKLLARKRPRLVPIWDAVVAKVTGTEVDQWVPLRAALAEDDRALHERLLGLREAAGLPEQVSALRVLDVVCWMEGKDKGYRSRAMTAR